MSIIYNIISIIAWQFLKIVALFNPKLRLFVQGRTTVFSDLKKTFSPTDKIVWFHCASLGEFEQGRPIMEQIKKDCPHLKILVTFFSPSGYEVRKHYKGADFICYLPLDTKRKARKFVNTLNLELAVFVKYEFWPNYLAQLKKKKVKTVLVSGIFRENQVFFKWYGGWMRSVLQGMDFLFVQDDASKLLLNKIGIQQVTVAGDTRFDRVFEITQQDNYIDFIHEFVDNSYVLVAGSTWKEDEELLVNYINNKATDTEKFIIAPHNIKPDDIKKLQDSIEKKVVLFSEKEGKDLKKYQVFIVDTIGILTKIYSSASVAYIGGGFTKSGVHNVLEPATFGLPLIIGPNYIKFNEAIELVQEKGCFSIENVATLDPLLVRFYTDDQFRKITGEKAINYVRKNIGATQITINNLQLCEKN
ncbi:MAG: 3-deoxy-D-manno-octulosonic acid transferase [Flavobacteriaceae bacterium]|nr:3-deoxy-D-manno-octulosonic acid transferase [Flavobacteriaceae bacterium]